MSYFSKAAPVFPLSSLRRSLDQVVLAKPDFVEHGEICAAASGVTKEEYEGSAAAAGLIERFLDDASR